MNLYLNFIIRTNSPLMIKSIEHHFTIKTSNLVRNTCNAFLLCGLQEFHHDITFKKGEISMLSSNPAVFKYWYNHRLPAIKTDENGRNLKAGIYLGSFIKKIDEISKKTLPLFQSQFCANQSLHILEHDK